MAENDDLLAEAKQAFDECVAHESENRQQARESIEFARLGVQWPQEIEKERRRERRPCLTINKLLPHIRQVVNDARQNKPGIQIHAADDYADPETAQIFGGLIRNIEYQSNADVAYDTATDCAVSGGIGYMRVVVDYAYNDAFDSDIMIKRVSNPFSIYGDPNSKEADSSDWNSAFVTEQLTQSQWDRRWKSKAKTSWDDTSWTHWRDAGQNMVTVAEWWTREQVDRKIYLTDTGMVLDEEQIQGNPDIQLFLQTGQMQIVREEMRPSHKVTQRFVSGAEVLEENEWRGCYIPIIPVYGDEFDFEGKRYWRSLVYNAMDAQRNYNYWRSNATETVALAPKVPFIGPKGAFDSDLARWQTANTDSHAFLEYDGNQPPQRQPLDMGRAAGALQEALNAADDIKATTGQFDASLGARSNETSGRAIMARQREGDVATFHFIDNMARAVRCTGKILIDLIPKVYTTERMIRVLGEDGEQATAQIGPQRQRDDATGKIQVHSLTLGKYDLTVSTGPSFTSRREEAAVNMTELIRAYPPAAPVIGPELAKVQDWPGAKKLAEKLEAVASGQLPPEAQQQMEAMKAEIQKLQQENMALKQDKSDKIMEIQSKHVLGQQELQQEGELEVLKIESNERSNFFKAQANAAAQASRPVVQSSASNR